MAAGALTRCADTLCISNMKSFEDLHAPFTTHRTLAFKPDLYAHVCFLTLSKVCACEYRLHAEDCHVLCRRVTMMRPLWPPCQLRILRGPAQRKVAPQARAQLWLHGCLFRRT